MDNRTREHFKKLLIKQGNDVEGTIQLMRENKTVEQSENSPDELSNYDNHPAELGTEVFQMTMNNALLVHEENLLKEIHDALERVEDGSFGDCELCGETIAPERLEALPYARLCIQCEEHKPKIPPHLDRPVEEEIWDAPLGRKYLNQREDDEFEGLDYLNDLVKYGSSDSPQDMGGYYDYEEYYTNEIDRQGIVDDMDRVSNEEYRKQLPD